MRLRTILLSIFYLLLFSHYVFSQRIASNVSPLQVQVNKKLERKFNSFLKADTKEARSMLFTFSSLELETLWNRYKRNKTLQEKRILWFIEEYHARRSDEVAKSRLLHLFLATTLLLLLIVAFLHMIIVQQKKMASKL